MTGHDTDLLAPTGKTWPPTIIGGIGLERYTFAVFVPWERRQVGLCDPDLHEQVAPQPPS